MIEIRYLLITFHGIATPPTWDRFHIDWILFRNPDKGGEVENLLSPRFISVVVDDNDYKGKPASDHFPVVAIFSVNNGQ